MALAGLPKSMAGSRVPIVLTTSTTGVLSSALYLTWSIWAPYLPFYTRLVDWALVVHSLDSERNQSVPLREGTGIQA